MPDLTTIVLATGALGTAAFGVVEGLKVFAFIGEAGFKSIPRILGPLQRTLVVAYGEDQEKLLRAQFRGNQSELARILRQGVRAGLTEQNAPELAKTLGSVHGDALVAAITRINGGGEPTAEDRNVIGRFELAADARIDAALALAQSRYAGSARFAAGVISVLLAIAAGLVLSATHEVESWSLLRSVLVGIAAVPLAPIAKDVASGLQAASQALRRK